MTYRAWAISHDGVRYDWTGLRRTQAVWRDRWCQRNSLHLNLKQWGWERVG